MIRVARVLRAALLGIAMLAAGCGKPEPPRPPAVPGLPRVTIESEETLELKSVYLPAAGGKYAVAIFANGKRVIDGTLSPDNRREHFHGRYQGHEIDAKCALAEKVDCDIVVDGDEGGATGEIRKRARRIEP
jgi:hypothetical protein